MYAATSARTTLRHRVKLALATALLTLSLAVGAIATVQPVNAAPPVDLTTAQTATNVVVTEDMDDAVAAKSKGGGKQSKGQKKTHCTIITDPVEWELLTGYPAGADFVGGMWCMKI